LSVVGVRTRYPPVSGSFDTDLSSCRAHSSGADLLFAEQGACPVFLFSVVQRYFRAQFFGCGCWFIKSSLSSPQMLTGLWIPFAFLPSLIGWVHSPLGSSFPARASDSQESATACLADFICSIPCQIFIRAVIRILAT
jgi:hypothetical protein